MPEAAGEQAPPARRSLVLITGTGRSGTSTASGMLHHLGLHVPGPYLGANESNPKGFFESRWAMRFHKSLLAQAGLHDFDGRPDALERVRAHVTPERRAQLVTFLRKRSAGQPHTVVKDPRSVWIQPLWRDAAAEAGLEIGYLSMLRHPAEVVGSRATYYMPNATDARRRWYQVFNVGRWVNNALINEEQTRGHRRTFVRYDDLLGDWRTAAARIADELGLTYPTPPVDGAPHPVDDFIDPDLRRVTVTWDDLDVPAPLLEVAEAVWQALLLVEGAQGAHPEAEAELDRLRERYADLFTDSAAISLDAQVQARAEGVEEGRRLALEDQPPAPSEPGRRTVEETRAGELVGEVLRRGARRLRERRP